jgi:hypothetical protein
LSQKISLFERKGDKREEKETSEDAMAVFNKSNSDDDSRLNMAL